MRTDSGILQQATVYSFIYSTSYQTENSTLAASSKGQHCVFLPSRSCVLPERAACSLTPASLSLALAFSLINKIKNPGRISFCKGHRTAKEGQVGRCRRVEAHRAQGSPGCVSMVLSLTAVWTLAILTVAQEVEVPGVQGLESKVQKAKCVSGCGGRPTS